MARDGHERHKRLRIRSRSRSPRSKKPRDRDTSHRDRDRDKDRSDRDKHRKSKSRDDKSKKYSSSARRDRRRSRSPERSKSPDKRKSPDRKRSPERRKSPERKEFPERQKSPLEDTKPVVKPVKVEVEIQEEAAPPQSKEDEQKDLEIEMQKRRERVEKWRAERKIQEMENGAVTAPVVNTPAKKWSLEDDDEEEEDDIKQKVEAARVGIMEALGEVEENPVEEVDEEDPLDSFMQSIENEVRQVKKLDSQKTKGADIDKGELLEQNQDALEYSSEEETEDLATTMSGLIKQKEQKVFKVDHNKIKYLPFRKDFYVEIPEIARMTPEEVEEYRLELEGIKVKGKGCPKPIKTWAQCGVSKKEMEILKKLSYEKPTPIQAQTIPAIMSGGF